VQEVHSETAMIWKHRHWESILQGSTQAVSTDWKQHSARKTRATSGAHTYGMWGWSFRNSPTKVSYVQTQ
jgi:hypothetical protein